MHKYTDEQRKFIERECVGITTLELTKKFNECFKTNLCRSQICSYLKNHGLRNGVVCQFKKGQTSFNKGNKFPGQTNKTSFKKGNVPVNTDPIGIEKLLSDGYILVKVDNRPKVSKKINWMPKHVKIWQDTYGLVPEGHVVIFLDGNKRNFDLDNLKVISKATNARLNQNHLRRQNKEFTKTGIAIAEVITATAKAKRRMGGIPNEKNNM